MSKKAAYIVLHGSLVKLGDVDKVQQFFKTVSFTYYLQIHILLRKETGLLVNNNYVRHELITKIILSKQI